MFSPLRGTRKNSPTNQSMQSPRAAQSNQQHWESFPKAPYSHTSQPIDFVGNGPEGYSSNAKARLSASVQEKWACKIF
jgi:hypothetical protein